MSAKTFLFSLADPCCPFFSPPLHVRDYLENRADFPARWKSLYRYLEPRVRSALLGATGTEKRLTSVATRCLGSGLGLVWFGL